MSVGYTVTKSDLDARAGGLAVAVRSEFEQIANLKIWLDAQADLVLTGMGYTVGEVSILRSAVADLAKLGDVYRGTQTQTPVYDFRTFAKQLTGTQ